MSGEKNPFPDIRHCDVISNAKYNVVLNQSLASLQKLRFFRLKIDIPTSTYMWRHIL